MIISTTNCLKALYESSYQEAASRMNDSARRESNHSCSQSIQLPIYLGIMPKPYCF